MIRGGRRALATERHPEMWLAQVETDGHGLVENAPLSAEEQGDELLLMGLRLREGVDAKRYEALSGRALRRRQIDDLVAEGFIEETATAASASPPKARRCSTRSSPTWPREAWLREAWRRERRRPKPMRGAFGRRFAGARTIDSLAGSTIDLLAGSMDNQSRELDLRPRAGNGGASFFQPIVSTKRGERPFVVL